MLLARSIYALIVIAALAVFVAPVQAALRSLLAHLSLITNS